MSPPFFFVRRGDNVIKSSVYLMFNGINSQDYGILNVSVDSGLYQESFSAPSSIIEQTIRGRENPYFIQTKLQPKTLSLTLSLPDNFDDETIKKISRWLSGVNYYAPLIFSETPDKIYYCLLTGEPTVYHNGNSGYLQIQMRTNSPYCFSPIYSSPLFDLSINDPTNGTEIEIVNNGDIPMFSEITVQVINGGTFSIVNKSGSGNKLSFSSLQDNETLTVNTENEDIQTDVPDTYRFGNITSDSVFLTFPRGINILQVFGNIKIQFKYEQRFLI